MTSMKKISVIILFLLLYAVFIFVVYLWASKKPENSATKQEQAEEEFQLNYEYTPEHSPANFEVELDKSRAKWDNAHITHYQMSIYIPYSSGGIGNLPMPLTVEVQDGNVVSVADAHGERVSPNDNVDSSYYYENYFTIPGLFSHVHQIYLEKPPSIRVTYDPTLGYPYSIYVNPYVEPCCQDYEIIVESFQVLSP